MNDQQESKPKKISYGSPNNPSTYKQYVMARNLLRDLHRAGFDPEGVVLGKLDNKKFRQLSSAAASDFIEMLLVKREELLVPAEVHDDASVAELSGLLPSGDPVPETVEAPEEVAAPEPEEAPEPEPVVKKRGFVRGPRDMRIYKRDGVWRWSCAHPFHREVFDEEAGSFAAARDHMQVHLYTRHRSLLCPWGHLKVSPNLVPSQLPRLDCLACNRAATRVNYAKRMGKPVPDRQQLADENYRALGFKVRPQVKD